MINRIVIRSFRGLRAIDVPLKPFTVLIGANNTGKSTFLSAIHLLSKVEGNAVKLDRTDHWAMDVTSMPNISAFIDAGSEVVLTRNRTEKKFWSKTGDASTITPMNFFNSAVLLPEMQSQGATQAIPQIDDKASNVPAFLDALLRKDRDRFFRVLDSLKKLIPGLANINIETPSPHERRIDLVFENGLVMEAKFASYGVKLIIFFVALANHPVPPKTILIEEPETGVHPRRLDDIIELLKGLSEGRYADNPTQIIVTTHSPYLMNSVEPINHQVLVFRRQPNGECTAAPIDNQQLKFFLDDFSLGEVWLNRSESGLVEHGI